MLGDLRYVDPGEYAAYADLEPPAMRATASRGLGNGAMAPDSAPRSTRNSRPDISATAPRSRPSGRYGQWLLGLPVAVVVNDTLFMHAGPSPVLRGMSLTDLNTRYRTALVDYLRPHCAAGARRPAAARRRVQRATRSLPRSDSRPAPRPAGSAARRDTRGRREGLHRAPTHTRCSIPTVPTGIAAPRSATKWPRPTCWRRCCEQFKVARVVVGHTPTRDLRAVTRFDGTRRQARCRHEHGRLQGSRRRR